MTQLSYLNVVSQWDRNLPKSNAYTAYSLNNPSALLEHMQSNIIIPECESVLAMDEDDWLLQAAADGEVLLGGERAVNNDGL